MKRRGLFRWLAAWVLLIPSISACASTRLTATWKDETTLDWPVQKVLVVGAFMDAGTRRLFEQECALQLTAQGSRAIAGSTLLSPERVPKYDELIALIKEHGADAVVVTRFTGNARDKDSAPALKEGDGAVPVLQDAWHGYYVEGYTALPPYAWKQERYELETVLYEVDTERPLWKVETELVAKGPVVQAFGPLVRIIVMQLRADRMVR